MILLTVAGLGYPIEAAADTLYMKTGSVEGEIIQEDDEWVRLIEERSDGSKRNMRYSKSIILKIKRTYALEEEVRAKDMEKKGAEFTHSERLTIHKAVEAGYDAGLTVDEAIAAAAEKFNQSKEDVFMAHINILFHRKYTYPDDTLRLKIDRSLRSFNLKYIGELMVLGRRVTIRYLVEIPNWEKSVMVQWVEERVPAMAEAVFDAVPEIDRISFEPRYSKVQGGSRQQKDTEVIKLFRFDRETE